MIFRVEEGAAGQLVPSARLRKNLGDRQGQQNYVSENRDEPSRQRSEQENNQYA